MKKIKSVWEDMPRKSSEVDSDDVRANKIKSSEGMLEKIKAAPEVTVIRITPSEMDMPKKIGASSGRASDKDIEEMPKLEKRKASGNRYKSVADLRARIAELEAKILPKKEETPVKKESNSKKTNMFDRNIEQEK